MSAPTLFDGPVGAPEPADPAPVAVASPDVAAECRRVFDSLVRRTAPEGRRSALHDRLRHAVVSAATGGRKRRVSACTPGELADVWRWIAWLRRGVWTAAPDDTGVTFTSTGGRAVRVDWTAASGPRPGSTGRARHSDPATSQAAAASLDRLSSQQAAVLAAVTARGEAICDEVAADVGNLPNRVARRLTDLRDRGLVADTGRTRAGQSGRQQIVWAPTSRASEAVT